MGYIEKQHRCQWPYIEGNGDLWECDECKVLWRSYAPVNPAYNGWRRAGWITRALHKTRAAS